MRAFPIWLLPVVVACSSSEEAAPGAPSVDAGPPTVSVESCGSRCVAKAVSCGAPTTQAQTTCGSICGRAVTEAEAACLEAKSCSDLITAAAQGASLSTLCPGLAPAPSGPTSVPPQLTIAAAIPAGYVVPRTSTGDLRSSLFNVASPAVFLPTLPLGQVPRFSESKDVTVVSPPRNGCESVINVHIISGQLAVSTSGVDILPDTQCADFIDAIAAEGATLTIRDVPWDGSTDTSTITVVLRRLASN